MLVKIKKLCKEAVIPSYSKPGDAGMDIVAINRDFDDYGNVIYGTGIAMEIPEGYVGLIFPRSSICKYDLSLTNCVGVIDSGYRGEIKAVFKPNNYFCDDPQEYRDAISHKEIAEMYNIGDKICQIVIMPYPKIEFEEVEDLTDSERGDGGYGSTGK